MDSEVLTLASVISNDFHVFFRSSATRLCGLANGVGVMRASGWRHLVPWSKAYT